MYFATHYKCNVGAPRLRSMTKQMLRGTEVWNMNAVCMHGFLVECHAIYQRWSTAVEMSCDAWCLKPMFWLVHALFKFDISRTVDRKWSERHVTRRPNLNIRIKYTVHIRGSVSNLIESAFYELWAVDKLHMQRRFQTIAKSGRAKIMAFRARSCWGPGGLQRPLLVCLARCLNKKHWLTTRVPKPFWTCT